MRRPWREGPWRPWEERRRLEREAHNGEAAHGGADGDQLKALRLKSPGVASGHMAASTFMLPRWLRDVARAGLRNHYTFDLENCHPTRFRIFEELRGRAERHTGKNCGEGAVPEAPLRWRVTAHEMTTFPMMDYALEFQRTVRALVAEDCSKNRDVLKRLRNETARPRELLCYVLNTAQERELIDRVANVVHRLDGNVLAYEHDGLFLEFEGDLGLLRNEIKSVLGEFAFTLKPQLSVQSALEAAEAVICKNAGPHTLAEAPRLRHEGIPADASWDFRPGRDADTRGPRQHAVPSARDLQDPLGHWAEVLVRPGQEDLGHDRGFRHRRAQMDRPGRVPARSVRLQDGLAHGGERCGRAFYRKGDDRPQEGGSGNFKVDLESLHLQSNARLGRLQDPLGRQLPVDQIDRCFYWTDAARFRKMLKKTKLGERVVHAEELGRKAGGEAG